MSQQPIIIQVEEALSPIEFKDILIRSTLGERRPITEIERLEKMCLHANLIVTARKNGILIGVARSLSDFTFCTYLSDLAVDKDHQRTGIGRQLVQRTKEIAPKAKLILLAAPAARAYYPKVGMRNLSIVLCYKNTFNMAIQTHPLTLELYEYLQMVSLRELDILKELREETLVLSDAIMQISPEQGQFMQLLIKLIGAKRILEVGVFTGYSTLAMVLALPEDGQLIACDISETWTAIAKKYWKRAGVEDRIRLYLEPAASFLKKLSPSYPFDFIFLDADQANYQLYYDLSLPLLRSGGLMLLDDTLWEGKVTNPAISDPIVNGIQKLNLSLLKDERVDISLLPIGDGVTLVRKR